MKPRERNGVRLGQPVRDVDGISLGKVVRLFDWGFETRRGLPILSGGRWVLRYDEIRAKRDGALVVSRGPCGSQAHITTTATHTRALMAADYNDRCATSAPHVPPQIAARRG